MKKNQIIFFSLLLLLTLFLVCLIYYEDQKAEILTRNSWLAPSKADRPISSVQLVENYKNDLTKIFNDFLEAKTFLLTDQVLKTQSLQELENQILAITVPKEYKELHLDLVISLNDLISQDQKKINQGKVLLNDEIKAQPWLASFLSIFVINYY
jgi:hypothetical protein